MWVHSLTEGLRVVPREPVQCRLLKFLCPKPLLLPKLTTTAAAMNPHCVGCCSQGAVTPHHSSSSQSLWDVEWGKTCLDPLLLQALSYYCFLCPWICTTTAESNMAGTSLKMLLPANCKYILWKQNTACCGLQLAIIQLLYFKQTLDLFMSKFSGLIWPQSRYCSHLNCHILVAVSAQGN